MVDREAPGSAAIERASARYAICGFVLHAHFPLLGLTECQADEGPLGRIVLRRGDVPPDLGASATTLRFVQISTAELLMDIPQAGRILVRGGGEIIVEPAVDASHSLQPYILGVAIGAVSLKKGLSPLHASAVSNAGDAIAFAGPSGEGKSTMAMAMIGHGYQALTDDLSLIVRNSEGGACVYPGSPLARLWPDSVDALRLDQQGTSVELEGAAKLLFRLGAGGLDGTPLSAIYFLTRADAHEITIKSMSTTESIAAFARDLYRRQWMLPMGDVGSRLAAMGNIARGVACFSLRRPHDYAALSAVSEVVAAHHAKLTAARPSTSGGAPAQRGPLDDRALQAAL